MELSLFIKASHQKDEIQSNTSKSDDFLMKKEIVVLMYNEIRVLLNIFFRFMLQFEFVFPSGKTVSLRRFEYVTHSL